MRLWSGLLDALHRSRQAQADAVIRRYSHLLDSKPFAEGEWRRSLERAAASTKVRVEAARAEPVRAAVLMPALRRRAVP